MEFKVGDKAYYPGRGIGIVKAVETADLEGDRQTYYVLKLLGDPSTILIPVNKAESIRTVISREHVEKVFDVLRDRDVPTDTQTWNRRYREYMNKIQTGDPIEVAKVLRDLALLKAEKNLSFGERRTYDHAHTLLVQELAVALDAEESTVEKQIEDLFKK